MACAENQTPRQINVDLIDDILCILFTLEVNQITIFVTFTSWCNFVGETLIQNSTGDISLRKKETVSKLRKKADLKSRLGV
jgi:hypothetical protein